VPFACDDQVFIVRGGNEIALASIDVSNSAIQYTSVAQSNNYTNMSIGFNPQDGFIYGVCNFKKAIFRVGSNGNFEELIKLNVSDVEDLIAAEIVEFGRFLMIAKSTNNIDEQFLLVNLIDGQYTVSTSNLNINGHLTDFAQHPYLPSVIFGWDERDMNPVRFDRSNASSTNFPPITGNNRIEGMAYDAFGDVYAYGSVEGGIASGLFKLNRQTNVFNRLTTGPETFITDITACPYALGLHNSVDRQTAFPCDTIQYLLIIANATNSPSEIHTLNVQLPVKFEILEINHSSNNGNISIKNNTEIEVTDYVPDIGLDTFIVDVIIGDLFDGDYLTFASLKSGSELILADDPSTLPKNDQTRVRIRSVNVDDLNQELFLCIGDSLSLDVRPFGSSFLWQDGSTEGLYSVLNPGIYTVSALSGCQSLDVQFEVETANCPFSIEIAHSILPNESLRCSEVLFQYIFENTSGVEQAGISFVDEMPEGFSIISVETNTIGGILFEHELPASIHLENARLKAGLDTIIMRVEVGDIDPGMYSNVAILDGLQASVGTNRVSFDPDIPGLDSTRINIIGTVTDSIFVDVPLCENTAVVLDGTVYGVDFRWYDGSNKSIIEIDQIGIYELEVFSGCENSYVFFNVIEAENVDIEIEGEVNQTVNLGDSIQLIGSIHTELESYTFTWIDTSGNSASCLDCLDPIVFPSNTSVFTLIADNGKCTNTSKVIISVDKTRRFFIPNAFAPDSKIANDLFSIKSPQFLEIVKLLIFDKWGNIVFNGSTDDIRTNQIYWDGTYENQDVEPGVYSWVAKLRFLDELEKVILGDVLLIR